MTKNIDNKYCYYKLQHSINDFLKSIRNGKINKDLGEIIKTSEVDIMFTSQHSTKTFTKDEIVKKFSSWLACVLHPKDAVIILRDHFEELSKQEDSTIKNER